MPFLKADSDGPNEIYYEEQGEGVPVVLIGGLTTVAEYWGLQIPALAERYRVIAPDNRGSGRTRVPDDDGARSTELFAADVLALIDGLGLERVHLVGQSMGGMIVQTFALAHPDRLRSLVIASVGPGGSHQVTAGDTFADLEQSAGGTEADDDRRLTGLAFHPSTFERRGEAVDLFLKLRAAWPHSEEEVAARMRAVDSFDVWDGLAELRLPTLVLGGAEDRIVPPENGRRVAGRIPGAERVEIPETGHAFYMEEPEATNAALLDFLDRN